MALVLGAAVWPGGVPSPTLRRRAEHAAALFLSGEVTQIITTGGLGKHAPTEASVAAEVCRAAGVPPDAIRCEERSTTTLENIRFACGLFPDIKDLPLVIVTDRYHAPRARLVGRHLGLDVRSTSPRGQGTPLHRRMRSGLREAPAYLWYMIKLRREG